MRILPAIAIAALPFAAHAQAPAELAAKPPAIVVTAKPSTSAWLHQVVCRYQEQIGSRLQGHRVCLENQEWRQREEEERLRQDRRIPSVGRQG